MIEPTGRWPRPVRNQEIRALAGEGEVEEAEGEAAPSTSTRGRAVRVGEGVGLTFVNVRPTMHVEPPFWTKPAPEQTSEDAQPI